MTIPAITRTSRRETDHQAPDGRIYEGQRALNRALRANRVPEDGLMGRETERALRDYQTRHHLPVTGRFDTETMDSLLRREGHTTESAIDGRAIEARERAALEQREQRHAIDLLRDGVTRAPGQRSVCQTEGMVAVERQRRMGGWADVAIHAGTQAIRRCRAEGRDDAAGAPPRATREQGALVLRIHQARERALRELTRGDRDVSRDPCAARALGAAGDSVLPSVSDIRDVPERIRRGRIAVGPTDVAEAGIEGATAYAECRDPSNAALSQAIAEEARSTGQSPSAVRRRYDEALSCIENYRRYESNQRQIEARRSAAIRRP